MSSREKRAAKKPPEPFVFDIVRLPASIQWRFNLILQDAEVAAFCEALYAVMHETRGMVVCTPGPEGDTNSIRFEWPLRQGRDHGALRLGILVALAEGMPPTIVGYATTHEIVKQRSETLPAFTSAELLVIRRQLDSIVSDAVSLMKSSSEREFHLVFFLMLPPTVGVRDLLHVDEPRAVIYPTVILRAEKQAASAVVLTVRAHSEIIAKSRALPVLAYLAALITLATNARAVSIVPKRPRRSRAVTSLEKPVAAPASHLYPPHTSIQLRAEAESEFRARIARTAELAAALPSEQRGDFENMLFAYYAGNQASATEPTLALIAYIAVLNAMAQAKIEKCPGAVSCSICGEIRDFKHNLTGDAAAIVKHLSELLELNPETAAKIQKIIRKTYREQRSAFVHSAVLRHRRAHEKHGLLSALPGEASLMSDLYFYEAHLQSLESISRAALLAWLYREVGRTTDLEFFGIDPLRLRRIPGLQVSGQVGRRPVQIVFR